MSGATARPEPGTAALPAASPAERPIGLGGAAAMVTLCAIWGLAQVSIKIGAEGISPLWQAAMRSAGAAVVIAAWMAWRHIPLRPAAGTVGWGVLIGLAFALEFVFLFIGLTLTTASRGSVLLYTAPFFVAIGMHASAGQRLSGARWAGLALAFVGVAVALIERAPGGAARGDWRGDLMCVAAAACWAATTLMIKASPLRDERPERTLLFQLVVSAPLLLAAGVLLGERGIFAPSPVVWAAIAWQVLVVASFSYLAWFVMVQRHSAQTVSVYTFLTPLFGVAFGALLLGESITPSLTVAAALIAAGIWLVNRR